MGKDGAERRSAGRDEAPNRGEAPGRAVAPERSSDVCEVIESITGQMRWKRFCGGKEKKKKNARDAAALLMLSERSTL